MPTMLPIRLKAGTWEIVSFGQDNVSCVHTLPKTQVYGHAVA
jgi:hypothetical protein